MALKAVLTKAELDALAEPVRKEYVERDGKFTLVVEGLEEPPEVKDLKIKLGEFRENNRKYHNELEELRPLKTKFAGVDPEEYQTLKAEREKLKSKGVAGADDVAAAIEAAVAKRMAPMEEKLKAEEKARQEAQQKMIDSEFEKRISEVALKAGVRQQAVDKVIPIARGKFEFKDGEIVPRPGVRHPSEPHKDLTPIDWLQDLAKSDDYLFAPSEGTGAQGNRGKKASGKILINPTSEEMGRNMDAIAKGEITVVRQ
jgi:hypothetical protein